MAAFGEYPPEPRTVMESEVKRLRRRIAELEFHLKSSDDKCHELATRIEVLEAALRTIRNINNFDSGCSPNCATSKAIQEKAALLPGGE